MKLSSPAHLLSGILAASDYSAEIAAELAEHSRGLQKPGGVAPVRVKEDTDIVLNRAQLSVLCRLFANGELSAEELAYTADALQLSARVVLANESIANHLAECTDSEVNGQLTVARALEIASSGNVA